MMHEIVVVLYRLIVLLVLAAVVRSALARENTLSFQITAIVLTIPLALRLLMIK